MALTVKPAFTATVPITPPDKFPERNYIDLDISFDNSYPTNGEPVDFLKYFKSRVVGANIYSQLRAVIVEGKNGYTFWYDKANKKLLAYTGGAEVGNGTNLVTAGLTDLTVILIGE
jgi:hypothetical protein